MLSPTVDEKDEEEEEEEGEYEDEDLNVLVEDVGVLNLHTKYIADAPSYCSSGDCTKYVHVFAFNEGCFKRTCTLLAFL